MIGSPQQNWVQSGLILAIYQHRRRIDELLARLDTPCRSSVEAVVAALIDGSLDAGTLVEVRFSRITEWTPARWTELDARDYVYGKTEALAELRHRRADAAGQQAHERAKAEHVAVPARQEAAETRRVGRLRKRQHNERRDDVGALPNG